MPILSLGDVMSLGTTLAGGRGDFATSEASAWANMALEQVSVVAGAHHKPREALAISSTTSGGNRVALPSDFDYPQALTLQIASGTSSTVTTWKPLRQRDAAFADAQQGWDAGGEPDYYVWYGTWLEIGPSPNSAYTLQLRYSARQPVLVDSTQTPNLDAKWHQAWLYKAAELYHAARSDDAGEALARNRYLNYVTTIETDQALSQHDRRSMSVRFGGARLTSSRGGQGD